LTVLRTPGSGPSQRTSFGPGDVIILIAILALIYGGIRLAIGAPVAIPGPAIVLAPEILPLYTALSVGRMAAAYILSLIFAISYGYAAAHSKVAARGLLPLLDVLQSIPILSFLPVAVLSLTALLPEGLAVELASILLILTSMVWNLAFSAYQSFTTVPRNLVEAGRTFRLPRWLRFGLIELPFAMRALLWNSLLSWAGGWFFLMAAETFVLRDRDFRLPGLGSYLQAAAQAGDGQAIAWGLAALIVTIVSLDQILWRPALAWAERYRLELVEPEEVTRSWLYDLLSRSWLVEQFLSRIWQPVGEWFEQVLAQVQLAPPVPRAMRGRAAATLSAGILVAAALAYGAFLALQFLAQLPPDRWLEIGIATGATAARVAIAVAVGTLWTVPAGILIGSSPRLAIVALPIVQVIASIPATALFPVFVVALVGLSGGLNLAAILLMLLGTQWYILFNVIAGVASIPRDLYDTAAILGMGGRLRLTTLQLPALYPYLITGLITASGGAWNASIVAEYVLVKGQVFKVLGVGALIAEATAEGDLVTLYAATLALIAIVVTINRLLWRPAYERAAERYRYD
jgi:NitT/TauT family transport system permease protein